MEKSAGLKNGLFLAFVLINLLLIFLTWADNLDEKGAGLPGYVSSASVTPGSPAGEAASDDAQPHRSESSPTPFEPGERQFERPLETPDPSYDLGDVGGRPGDFTERSS